jgi:NitT/TauT family transport system substrate-binding protein
MRNKLLIALMLGAAAVLPAVTAGAQAQTLKPWRHGVINLKSDAGFVMMPMQHDFMAKRGLKVEVVQVKDGAIGLKALISGELESLDGGAGEGIVAGMRGADVKTTGCHWPGLPHALFVRGDINQVEDLKGKSVATSAPGSLPDNMMRTLLEKYGMSPNDVTFAAVGGDNDRYKALIGGIVDATIVSSEYLPISPPGIKILVAGRDVIPNFMRLCLNMSGKTIAERRDDAIGFLAGEIEGLRYAFAHRDETIKLARDLSESKPDDPRPAFVFDWAAKANAVGLDVPLPMDKLDATQKALVSGGNMPAPIDLAKAVDPGPRERALGLLAGH